MRKPVFFLKFLFLLCLVAGGGNPLPANAVLPLFAGANRGREIFGFQRLRRCGYLPGHTGGEKFSDFSDFVAVAIRLLAQGERNIQIFATSVLWLSACTHRRREIFGFQRLRCCGCLRCLQLCKRGLFLCWPVKKNCRSGVRQFSVSSFSICFVVFVKNVSLIKLGFMSDK